jgi:lysophospholipase L1-like esterase
VSLVACVLAAEASMRLFGIEPVPNPIGPRHLFVADPLLGIRLRPAFAGTHRHPEFSVPVRVNALGFRDREVGPKDPGVFRILSLGDSFTFGTGVPVEETYSRLLEEELARAVPGRRFEVINAGTPSYGTRHLAQLYRRHATALAPDLVLVAFLPANDLADNVSVGFTERNGIVMIPFLADLVDRSPWLRFAVNWSDLALLLERWWLEYTFRRDSGAAPVRLDEEAAAESAPGIEVLRRAGSAELEQQWAATAVALRDLAEATRDAGARLAVLHIPIDFQVDERAWRAVAKRHGLRAEDHDLDLAARRLRELCAASGTPVFDLLEPFRARAASGPPLYFRINKHFSAEGHRAAAAHLAAEIVRQGFVKR